MKERRWVAVSHLPVYWRVGTYEDTKTTELRECAQSAMQYLPRSFKTREKGSKELLVFRISVHYKATVKTSSKSGSEDTLDLPLPRKINMYRFPRDPGEMPILLAFCRHLHITGSQAKSVNN